MIRDPSDGSVKEIPTCKESLQVASGLPFASTKPEQQARIERSREWLKNYRLGTTTSTETSTATTGDQRAEKDAT